MWFPPSDCGMGVAGTSMLFVTEYPQFAHNAEDIMLYALKLM
jgi:hypothetical protein